MRCEKCQAEFESSATADPASLLCPACQAASTQVVAPTGEEAPLTANAPPSPAPLSDKPIRDARELLARWAQEDAIDRMEITSSATRPAVLDKSKPAVKYHGSHPAVPAAVNPANQSFAAPLGSPAVAPATPAPVTAPSAVLPPVPVAPQPTQPVETIVAEDRIIHRAHEPNSPHFMAIPVVMADKSSRWVASLGQIMAYIGVGGLTVGTALVLTGFFGDQPVNATTGWLIATSGQMLLFLGVVTMISGGMEQTTQEVAKRIDLLSDRLDRMEQAGLIAKAQAQPQQNIDAAKTA